MREIKFRALDLNKQFVYGGVTSPLHSPENKLQIVSLIQISEEGEDYMFIDIIPESLGQYTGLHDKNGKEIYEGDILKYSVEEHLNSVGDLTESPVTYQEEVHFLNGSFDLDGCPLYVFNEVGEVIGNIHSNPELLKTN